jgi:DNA-binding NtrC family response regulator
MNAPAETKTILVVDDKRNILTVIETFLTGQGYRVVTAQGGRDGYRRAVMDHPDLILCDIRMNDIDGLQLAAMLKTQGLSFRFVFITAFATVQGAVDAMKGGAFDYLTKPLDYERMREVIRQALAGPVDEPPEKTIIGSSPSMMKIFGRIAAVANSNSTVLIVGESGTGKELIARAIHRQSKRNQGPFIPVHCASFNEQLLESELFGYERGAFTGAENRKKGFFEVADGGTLFLDEISEVSMSTQVSLLRVLQERSFNRVGGTDFVRVDVRLIAATNQDLIAAVSRGDFREDLYYRLNVVPMHVPPLRDRRSDIPELCNQFLHETCLREQIEPPEVDDDVWNVLNDYHWPGNVRELQNFLERLVVLHRPDRITQSIVLEEFGSSLDAIRNGAGMRTHFDERDVIIDALRSAGGNKTDAARSLGFSRRTIYNRIARHGISPDEYA